MPNAKTYTPTEGYVDIAPPGEMGTLQLGILNLTPNATYFDHSDDTEVALIALGGNCTLLVGHNGNKANGILGERPDVFHGEACVAFIPHHTTYEVLTGEAGIEIAVCKTASHSETAAVILGAGEVADETNRHLHITENEMPNRRGGEAVCLIRYPHEESTTVFQFPSIGDGEKKEADMMNHIRPSRLFSFNNSGFPELLPPGRRELPVPMFGFSFNNSGFPELLSSERAYTLWIAHVV